MNENQNNREVKEDGLKAIWKKIFELIKKITGDVDFNKDGTLQAQILKKVSTDEMKNVEVEFSSQDTTNVTTWTDVEVLASGEKHQSVLNKVSIMFKNIRYLYHMLGTADISALGDGADIGTVTGALSKLNSDLNNSQIIAVNVENPFSGTIYYTVRCGICIVMVWFISCGSGELKNAIICKNLPYSAMCAGTLCEKNAGGAESGSFIYIDVNTNTLCCHKAEDCHELYGSFCYPVIR